MSEAAKAVRSQFAAYLDELDAKTRRPCEKPLRQAVAEQARERLREMTVTEPTVAVDSTATYGVCLRYQEVRGDRLAFSCECNGDGCPNGPGPVR